MSLLGKYIKEHREDNKLSKRKLAELANISHTRNTSPRKWEKKKILNLWC